MSPSWAAHIKSFMGQNEIAKGIRRSQDRAHYGIPNIIKDTIIIETLFSDKCLFDGVHSFFHFMCLFYLYLFNVYMKYKA